MWLGKNWDSGIVLGAGVQDPRSSPACRKSQQKLADKVLSTIFRRSQREGKKETLDMLNWKEWLHLNRKRWMKWRRNWKTWRNDWKKVCEKTCRHSIIEYSNLKRYVGTLTCKINMWLKKEHVVDAFLKRLPLQIASLIRCWLGKALAESNSDWHGDYWATTDFGACNRFLHYTYYCEQLLIIYELVPSICCCIQERTNSRDPWYQRFWNFSLPMQYANRDA